MKALLFSMPDTADPLRARFCALPNLGLTSIAANAGECEVKVADLVLRRHRVEGAVIDTIRQTRPNLIGLSAMTFQFPTACKIAEIIRREHPNIPLVLGGYHATLAYREIADSKEAPLPLPPLSKSTKYMRTFGQRKILLGLDCCRSTGKKDPPFCGRMSGNGDRSKALVSNENSKRHGCHDGSPEGLLGVLAEVEACRVESRNLYTVEGCNSLIRHYLARFGRKSKCYMRYWNPIYC